jgi:heme O synthase-like polyprenyltransferase
MRDSDRAIATERLDGHSEATKALVLAVAGLMTFMLISNLVSLILY